MRILHTEASEGWGGQDIRVLVEAREMQSRGHFVVLACTEGCALWQHATAAGLPCEAVVFGTKPKWRSVAATRRIIRRHRIQIVNTHSSGDGWSGAITARLSGVPCVRTRHLANAIKANAANRFLYGRLTDFVITTGEAVRQQIIDDNGVSPARIKSVATGVDTAIFDPARYDPSPVRQEFSLTPSEFVWGMIAMIRRIKGHALLVEAAAELLQTHPHSRFLLVGEAPAASTLRQELEAKLDSLRISDRFIFTGYRDDIAPIMAACDALVLPSLSEGLPQALTQGLAMARPVVATRVGGIPEIVRSEETGLLVPSNDAPALAVAMARIMDEPEHAAEMGSRGRSFIVANYGLASMVDEVEAIYAGVLERCGRPAAQ